MFVLVPRNKSGHMNDVHYLDEPINFLVVPTEILYMKSSEFSLALLKKLQSLTTTKKSTHVYTFP